MLSKEEFAELLKDKKVKLSVITKCYRAYQTISQNILDNPEIIDKLINSSKIDRRGHREELCNSLIETTPNEIDQAILLITALREELHD